MKTKTRKEAVFFIFLLLSAGLFAACSDAIAVSAQAGVRSVWDQRSNNALKLSEMSEEDCIAFIIAQGVSIPTEYAQLPDLGASVKKLIQVVELDPDYRTVVSYKVQHDFIMDIKNAVNDYYQSLGISYAQTSRASYELQYNLVMNINGQWDRNSGGLGGFV